MKRIITLIVFMALCTAAMAADPAAVTPVTPVTAAPAAVGFLDWFRQNTATVLGFALAFSELLSLIPAFKGNGLLDSIIKALQALSSKPAE